MLRLRTKPWFRDVSGLTDHVGSITDIFCWKWCSVLVGANIFQVSMLLGMMMMMTMMMMMMMVMLTPKDFSHFSGAQKNSDQVE